MDEILLPENYQMLPALELAQVLGEIPTEKQIEVNKKNSYLLIGAFIGVSLLTSAYFVYDGYKARKNITIKKISEIN